MTALVPLPPNDPSARCKHCSRTTDLIQHDGPVVVCRSCLLSLGQLAADPEVADDRILAAMLKRHGDVVHPIRVGRPSRLVWEWIGWE